MNSALIVDGRVAQVVIGRDVTDRDGEWVVTDVIPVPGQIYADGAFTNPHPPAPSRDPRDYPLSPVQFEAALILLGIDAGTVEGAIRAFVPDKVQQAMALAKFRKLELARREDPLIAAVSKALPITDDVIDAVWMQVAGVAHSQKEPS